MKCGDAMVWQHMSLNRFALHVQTARDIFFIRLRAMLGVTKGECAQCTIPQDFVSGYPINPKHFLVCPWKEIAGVAHYVPCARQHPRTLECAKKGG